MAGVGLGRRYWRDKPSELNKVRAGHPLAAGLVFYAPTPKGAEWYKRVTYSYIETVSPYGPAMALSATDDSQNRPSFYHARRPRIDAPVTHLIWFRYGPSSSTASQHWAGYGTLDSNQLQLLGIFNSNCGALHYTNDLSVTASTYADGKWHSMIYTHVGGTGGAMTLYIDGVSVATATYTPNVDAGPTPSYGCTFGGYNSTAGGTTPSNWEHRNYGLWSRALSQAEVTLLHSDPFCMLRGNN